jgi:fused signal recognition particle receptor
MAFDWFRRRFNQSDEPPQPTEAEQPPAAPASEPEPEAPSSEPPAADYLTWAKTAYQNIQKQQAPIADAPESTAAEVVPEVLPEPEIAVTIEDAAPEPAAPEMPLAAGSKALVQEPSTPTVDGVAPDAAAGTIAETIDPAVPDNSAVPFWARAEAERLERLERLKETAIREPEPVVATAPAPIAESPSAAPNLEFDEGFLWSAEILAAQGRRPDQISLEEITWLKRLRQGLDKTRRGLVNQLRAIVGQGPLNEAAVMEIEAALLQADVGVAATDAIIEALQAKLRSEVLPPDAAITYLKQILREMLDAPLEQSKTPFFAPEKEVLNIWLITGVNGAGKTTTIGKLAHIAQKSGYNCLIAAADTFRAAAVEQVKVWGGRSGVEVIANPGQNTDPAAVVFDAIAAAQARKTELLLVDTAGRLQNKKNLMDELSKIRRIIDKKSDTAVVESLLVLDATLGQNGLRQAEVFAEAAQLSGVVLTKLDGTAKGGIALAVVQQLGLPIRFIGAGEGIEDLRPFSSYEFVEALLDG